ncbi:thiol-disulfide oxidoreductase DCC family protein [Alicyclobacillus hesperidum]|uniref:Predicted thiol-disulfide oxidoreductase YuxK, DCC family n=1 Tax=Alicyclobacillus hesperidum TaxID=89784 RepID=A0A1H2W8E5_9BACL|nr:DCC1-like thiol-disulfide oxidoreductase family protein [Alicyclobacillus hesperidum]SDW76811.1 Predicted thiol-disulfide oxidoreductase YuxK, DCC family [Alicyclobacillus hesperidum]
MAEDDKIIVLFDGVCPLCNGIVDWLLRRDRKDILRFASLQSPFAEKLLEQHGMSRRCRNSVYVFFRGTLYERSSAIVQICTELPWPWSWLSYFRWIPQETRDTIYDWVARHRYAWFGQRNACRIPAPNERKKFLDDW